MYMKKKTTKYIYNKRIQHNSFYSVQIVGSFGGHWPPLFRYINSDSFRAKSYACPFTIRRNGFLIK